MTSKTGYRLFRYPKSINFAWVAFTTIRPWFYTLQLLHQSVSYRMLWKGITNYLDRLRALSYLTTVQRLVPIVFLRQRTNSWIFLMKRLILPTTTTHTSYKSRWPPFFFGFVSLVRFTKQFPFMNAIWVIMFPRPNNEYSMGTEY